MCTVQHSLHVVPITRCIALVSSHLKRTNQEVSVVVLEYYVDQIVENFQQLLASN